MKKIILASALLLLVVTACTRTTNNTNNENNGAVTVPHGIKPIIYYHGKHYGIFKKVDKLPQDFKDSGDKIIGSEIDDDTLPNRECYTSTLNANNVGANIFRSTENDTLIFINVEGGYLAFRHEEYDN